MEKPLAKPEQKFIFLFWFDSILPIECLQCCLWVSDLCRVWMHTSNSLWSLVQLLICMYYIIAIEVLIYLDINVNHQSNLILEQAICMVIVSIYVTITDITA